MAGPSIDGLPSSGLATVDGQPVGGGRSQIALTFAVTGVSATTAALGSAAVYVATATGITITISTADITDGREFTFSDESGLPSVGTPITIATEGAQTIDGAATAVITVPFGSISLYARGGDLFSN